MKVSYIVLNVLLVFTAIETVHAQSGVSRKDSLKEQSLKEIKVISNFATERKTPVAMSTVTAKQIGELYGGSTELPEVLKVTPGVYATKSGGGVGDSRLNIRGFDQRNIAVTINGIPVNDMENGWVYWSNWAGLGDAVSTIQVQRGLGASKLAINSVGGTMNIITKTTDSKLGASIQTQITNYGQYKLMAYASTGLMKNGFALTTVLSKTAGNSYVDGTWVDAYSYFFTLAKQLGEKNRLVLTGIGAPQSHGQRSTGLTQGQIDTLGFKYNPDYGIYDNGEMFNERVNYYHKPQFSLNHYWTPTSKTNLSTSMYYSIGHGGGSGRLGSSYSRDSLGLIDVQAAYDYNVANPTATNGGVKYAQRNSVNNHYWYGVISTLNHQLNKKINLTLGIDGRYYLGEHFREVSDLLGGSARFDANNGLVGVHEYASNYGNVFHVTPVDQRVAYDNDGIVKYAGLFGQAEYSNDKLSAFLTGALNTTSNQRVDRMLYKNDTTGRGQNSEVVSIVGYSFKGGLNYNINEQHNFYMNAGKFSRAPFFSFVFVNNSNDVVQNLVNEKAESFELGYGFRTDKVAIKLNAYYTNWKDKSLLSGNITGPNGSVTRALMTGANALHKGIELEFNTKPIKNLEIGGIVSLGDWRWKGDINATVYSEIDPNISSTVTSFVDGVHVGDAPQNQYGLQGRYQITKGLYAGFTFVYNDKFYSNFDPSKKTDIEDKVDSYKIPSYYNLDARIGYDIQLKNYKIQLAIQGFNLTDVRFLSDATDLDGTTFAYAFPGFGRNFNFSAKISF